MKSSRLGLEGREWGRRENDQLEQIMFKTAVMGLSAFYANENIKHKEIIQFNLFTKIGEYINLISGCKYKVFTI